jgi:nitrite reductase (NADH) small subunit
MSSKKSHPRKFSYRKEVNKAIMAISYASEEVTYNLGPLSRIPIGEGRNFQIEDTIVAVFRARNGKLFATQATCPHKQGPLADGIIGVDSVICPLHAYKFSLKSGEAIGNTCEALKIYPVSISDNGDILLTWTC